MKTETEVLVIGGGAVGVCTAHFLLKRGYHVTLVEKGEICSGSSYGNAGLVVPNHCVPLAEPGVIAKGLKWLLNPDSPFYIKPRLNADLLTWLWQFWRHCNPRHVHRSMPLIRDLSLASVSEFEQIAALEGVDFGFEQKGMLQAFRSKEGLEAGIGEARHLQEVGIQASIRTPEEMQALNPGLKMQVPGGVFYPQNGHLNPARFVQELSRYIGQKGARVLPNTEVLAIETSGRRLSKIETTRGDFAAEQIVLSGGSWSPQIAADLQLKLPIQPAKGYSITVRRPPTAPSVPTILAEAKVAVTPMDDLLRFAGTLELAGLDLSVNMRRVRAILRAVPTYLPDIHPETLDLVELWRGLRPCTPDGLPFLGRSQTYENLVVAAGHAMIGISLGPITGKLVAQVVSGEQPDMNLAALSVERFP